MDSFEHAVDVLADVVIPEAQHAIALRLDESRALPSPQGGGGQAVRAARHCSATPTLSLQPGLAASFRELAHAQDVALPLGHRDDAARIEEVEDVARPDTLVGGRSEEHTSELQSPDHLVCRLLLVKKK